MAPTFPSHTSGRAKRGGWLPAMAGLALVALLGLVSTGTALAQGRLDTVAAKFRAGERVTVPAGITVPHDLYAAGGEVRVDGEVDGDLAAAGREVDVAGVVFGDLLVAGGMVDVSGTVGGDLRLAAGQVTLRGAVDEDVLVTGGRLIVAPTARLGGDLILNAGQVTMAGTVDGDVAGQAGTYLSTGVVRGSELVAAGEAADPAPVADATRGVWDTLRWYAGIVLVGLLLVALAPRIAEAGAAVLHRQPLPSLGVGLLGLAGSVVGLILILVLTALLAVLFGVAELGRLAGATVFGGIVAAGVLVLAVTVIGLFLAHAVVGLALGRLAIGRPAGTAPGRGGQVAALALGALFVVLLGALPFVGWLLTAVSFLLGFGALLLLCWQRGRPDIPATGLREPASAPRAPRAPSGAVPAPAVPQQRAA